MKKLTLDQTWTLCLRMWKWIASVWKEGDDVWKLKEKWRRDHGFAVNCDSEEDCFFCEYTFDEFDNCSNCEKCPGVMVDDNFDCGHEDYEWGSKPKAFYAELLRLHKIYKEQCRLNRIRKGKK